MFQSVKPNYQVLYNQDCSDVFDVTSEPITPQHVELMVDEVADGGADVMLINSNANRVVYPSKVWQTAWDGYVEGDPSFFGSVPAETIERRAEYIGQMKHLADQCDYLATALQRCRQKGITPGVSLRMNDMHDAPWPDSNSFSQFWRDNPELHLKSVNARDWGSDGFDYAHAEVREYYLSLVRETAQDYDLDVLELDFSRFCFYFNRGNAPEHCRIMSDFLGEVREILAKTGRAIHLITRIASSPGAAYQLGFDVETWGKEGLVDAIIPTNSLGTAWNMPIDEFRELVGPNIAIYAGADVSGDRRDGLPVRYIPAFPEMLRGFSAGYLAAGADGVEVFNFFLARKHRDITAAEFFSGLGEMRSLETIRGKPRTHLLDADYWNVEFDLPEPVPCCYQEELCTPIRDAPGGPGGRCVRVGSGLLRW